MPKAPQFYLFHGADTRSSLESLHRWEKVFLEKYGMATKCVVDADELSVDAVKREIAGRTQSISLFPEPLLIIIKRLSVHEKTKAQATVTRGILTEAADKIGADVTVLLWEDKLLAAASGILQWFNEQVEVKRAKVSGFDVPSIQSLGGVAQKYVAAAGKSLDPEAASWLQAQYRQREKAARLAEKLRSTEVLTRDDRAWWVFHVLDQAVLLTQGSVIERELLQKCAEQVDSVSVFEIINALREERWKEVRVLYVAWARGQEEGAYFGFWSLLRIHFRKLQEDRRQEQFAQYGLQLLAELEVISKNSQVPNEILTELFFQRLSQYTGDPLPIVAPRRLWLSTLPLS